ncbi:MAG: hypothetical protein IPK16_10800 [Anaerolineales bacterium]|nr:hypothetical protein [Anaerolineales bacterium]
MANQEVHCQVDANGDPSEITWPGAGGIYARSIRLQISDWQDGRFRAPGGRCFPGHQETIAGTEGMIVTKRIITPGRAG